MMVSRRTLSVSFEDDQSQDSLIYKGETKEAPSTSLCRNSAWKVTAIPSKYGEWKITGTPLKFVAVPEKFTCSIFDAGDIFQTITIMSEYSNKSLEELRLEDYQLPGFQKPQKKIRTAFGVYQAECSVSGLFPPSDPFRDPFRDTFRDTFSDTFSVGFTSRNPTVTQAPSKFKHSRSAFEASGEEIYTSPMCTDTSLVESTLPISSTRHFSLSPTIDFALGLDPADVFTPPPSGPEEEATEPPLTASEAQQLVTGLLETLIKCMRVQNDLYRLLLLKVEKHLTNSSDHNDVDSKSLSASCRSKDEGSAGPDLRLPLEALVRCGDIQRALFHRLFTVCLVITQSVADSSDVNVVDHSASHPGPGVNSITQESMFDTLQSQLEDIAFKKKQDCGYARNPFSDESFLLATNQDVIQHDSNDKAPISAIATANRRQLPHGHGTLKTQMGQVVYKGDWCEGKRHGRGEAFIVSLSCTKRTTSDHGFYTGVWKHNMRHGSGKMVFSCGAVYEGQWQYDQMTGYGTLKLPDGTIQEGAWREGSLDGCVLFTWPHGVSEYREYEAGRVQLPSCKVEEKAAKKLSQMNEVRSQITHIRQSVAELKDDRQRLVAQLDKQKKEQAAMVEKLGASLHHIQQNFEVQLEQASRKQQKEHDKKLQDIERSELECVETISRLRKELEEANNARLCQICFDRPRDCIIMPCTHLLYCRKCVAEHKRKGGARCPTCRGPINGEVLCNVNS